jgi:stage II sporulation protein AA (anti-sigma F factor antagonist)
VSALQISEQQLGDVTILTLAGRLVLGDGDAPLRDCIDALIRDGRLHIVLKMHDVTYVDSCGIGALVAKYVTLHNRGGSLKLVCPSERCRHVLALTHLLSVLECYDSEFAALRSFAAREPLLAE